MTELKKQVQSYFEKYEKSAIVALRVKDKMIIAMPNKDIEVLQIKNKAEGDKGLCQNIFKFKKTINAVIISSLCHTKVISQSCMTIPPILDDLAQIVGPSVRCSKSDNIMNILSKLMGRNACTIKNRGAVAIGRTLDEADTATKVLEKGAKAFIESSMIGGAKPISKFESVIMHIIYKLKYSKKDQRAKLKELKK
ncbi:MAG: class II aldolase/adducin family protein [Bacillota bacterium]